MFSAIFSLIRIVTLIKLYFSLIRNVTLIKNKLCYISIESYRDCNKTREETLIKHIPLLFSIFPLRIVAASRAFFRLPMQTKPEESVFLQEKEAQVSVGDLISDHATVINIETSLSLY